MRVCVVGNGPNARGKGAEIDACDFVVRTTGFWRSGPGDVGEKLSAYAWFGAESQIPNFDFTYEHWITLPLRYRNPPTAYGCFWENVAYSASIRPIRWVTDKMWYRELACLTMMSNHDPLAPPSSGFTAVDMALHIMRPDELVLYGFDGTFKNAPGWGDNNPEWRDAGQHDLHAEKVLLYRLMTEGTWLGKPCATTVVWPDCPLVENDSV